MRAIRYPEGAMVVFLFISLICHVLLVVGIVSGNTVGHQDN